VFNSSFAEGRPSSPPTKLITNGYTTPPLSSRRQVAVDDDYDLFHIVLFYLYTDRICFTTTSEYTSKTDLPSTTDAEGVYAIAHRLMLDSLMAKALHFLESTSNVRNITARTFGGFGAIHEEVGKLYDEVFVGLWSLVKHSSDFEDFFAELDEDSAESKRANTKFRVMTANRLT
jgi:hypothetical protein